MSQTSCRTLAFHWKTSQRNFLKTTLTFFPTVGRIICKNFKLQSLLASLRSMEIVTEMSIHRCGDTWFCTLVIDMYHTILLFVRTDGCHGQKGKMMDDDDIGSLVGCLQSIIYLSARLSLN